MTAVESDWPVWVDGAFLPQGAPAIAADDPGFLLGMAVFDTLACNAGHVPFVQDHVARLLDGARRMEIEGLDTLDPVAAVHAMAEHLGARDAALRLTVTPGSPGAGPRLVVTTRPMPDPPAEGVRVLYVPNAKVAELELEAVKSTSRARNIWARRAATARGAYDALLGTQDGDVSEGTVSNLFVVIDGELRTPPLERGCLPGVTRGKVLELAHAAELPCREVRVEAADLLRAQEAFLTSTLVRVLPIVEVLDHRADLPPGGGPITRELARRLTELERAG